MSLTKVVEFLAEVLVRVLIDALISFVFPGTFGFVFRGR